jgi:hypothetical protein
VNLNPVHQFDRLTHCNQRYPRQRSKVDEECYFEGNSILFRFFFVLRDAYLFENIYLRDERGGVKRETVGRALVLWRDC